MRKPVTLKCFDEDIFTKVSVAISSVLDFNDVVDVNHTELDDEDYQLDLMLDDKELQLLINSIRDEFHTDSNLFCLYAAHYEQEEVPDNSALLIW